MSIGWNRESEDLLVFTVVGEVSVADLNKVEQETEELIAGSMNWKLLVLFEGFRGFTSEAGWGLTNLSDDLDRNVHKMALVGPPEWRDELEMFALKGLSPVEIDYFYTEADARSWLQVPG